MKGKGRLFLPPIIPLLAQEKEVMKMTALVRVTNAATGELKRWETPNAKSLAVKKNGSLVLTKLGKQLGYTVKGDILEAS